MNTMFGIAMAAIIGLAALAALGATARFLHRRMGYGVKINVPPCDVESSGRMELVCPVCAAKLKVKISAEGEV